MDQVLSQGPLFLVCLIFMMGVVIVVHEYGHYIAARLYGVAVESFSVGFGKPLVETTDKNGTRWRINWIPLGGFVSFLPERKAEDQSEQRTIDGKPFDSLRPLPKIVISLAGPAANFVLAALIFALSIGFNGVARFEVQVAEVQTGTPAEQGGLTAGDVLLEVGGRSVQSRADVSVAILVSPNKPLPFRVDRAGEVIDLFVTPVEVTRANEFGQIVPQSTAGFIMQQRLIERQKYGPISSLVRGVVQTGRTVDQTVAMLGRIVTGNMSIHAMSGPVSVGDISRRAVNQVVGQESLTGWQKTQMLFWMLLSVCAAVSVGVGFFNLLPLPVLDGGRVVFHAYEAVTGSKLPDQVEAFALRTSVFLLLLMVVVITWGDVIETGVFGRGGG